MSRVVAIEIGSKSQEVALNLCNKYGFMTYEKDFTTNKNYVGTINEIPVYINEKLEKDEIKEIMENKEFKCLNDGKYNASVEQVIRKHPNNDASKELISIELNVEGIDELMYINYCVNGYADMQMQIAKEQIDKICKDFGLTIIDELAGKDVVLFAKTNDKGYHNMYISPKKEFFDWENFEGFKYNDELKFDANLVKFYKAKFGMKYVVMLKTNINGKDIVEFVVYNFEQKFAKENFEKLLFKLGTTIDNVDVELNKQVKLVVKKVVKNDRVYINKRVAL